MLAVKGFFNDGGFVPLESIDIPKGRVCIVTVLDEPVDITRFANKGEEVKFLRKIFDDFDACDEPLPPEFDEIIAERRSIKRELDL